MDIVGFRHFPSGYHLDFRNGWTASVQWGRINYGSYYGADVSFEEVLPFKETAEVACWKGDEDSASEDVLGYQARWQIAAFLAEVSVR